MNDLQDVRRALANLAPDEKWQIAEWLFENLQQGCLSESGCKEVPKHLPDYAARRQQIFGDRTLPNMVLLGRCEERW
jgi:hypothetical protein